MAIKISYNAPVVLTFSLLCGLVLLINLLTNNALQPVVALHPHFDVGNPLHYLTLFTCAIGHESPAHLLNNMAFFLLLGPILEEKYGSKKLLLFMAVTALATSLLQLLLFNSGLWGASGLVFMFIMLASMVNVRSGELPLSFVLVATLFLGKELYQSFADDQISQFAHILGGICGSIFGWIAGKSTPNAPSPASDLLQ